jgi:hypothetical protein
VFAVQQLPTQEGSVSVCSHPVSLLFLLPLSSTFPPLPSDLFTNALANIFANHDSFVQMCSIQPNVHGSLASKFGVDTLTRVYLCRWNFQRCSLGVENIAWVSQWPYLLLTYCQIQGRMTITSQVLFIFYFYFILFYLCLCVL